ncbi:ipis-1-like [Dermacentor variabilis]|uniref:ipis-1-like n=1 Tax=Dermacentor variabilis TaxID=34621 RepID=UPI003F5C8630
MTASRNLYDDDGVTTTALTRLSLSLYAQLHSEHNDDNVLFSPYSLGIALSVIRDGGRRITAREISDIFQYYVDLHKPFKKFLSVVASYAPDVTFHMASRMLCDYRYKIREEYTSLLEDYYKTSVRLVGFKERAEGVRDEANAWVSKHTAHKIKDLLPPGSVNATTILVLMNAIYFKGFWEFPFQKMLVKPRTFHLDSNKSVTVKMMSQVGSFKVGRSEELKSRAVEMLYKGGKCSMVIILPDDVEGLSLSEEKLSESSLVSLLANLTMDNDVQLTVPRFKLEAGQSMKDPLRAMGVNYLFEEDEGDLSGIFEEVMTHLSDLVHKVLLQVDEGGTAMAAAAVETAIASPVGVTPLVVDHPFMFLIRSIESDVLLFMGSVRKL